MSRRAAPDQAERDRAVRERERNVLVDAGAGTGKTTLLVNRILELVAPEHGGEPIPLEAIAAITFTRKAAGELRFRLREALLATLAAGPTAVRDGQLRAALASVDTAHVGTIHAFADRLLRLEPAATQLSPAYQIVDDAGALHAEAFDLLLRGSERGTLAAELAGPDLDPVLADEAQTAILDALRAGVRAATWVGPFRSLFGLDALFQRLAETRDVPPLAPPPEAPDAGRFRAASAELVELLRGSEGEGVGSRWLRETASSLTALAGEDDPVRVLAGLRESLRGKPRMRHHEELVDDPAAQAAWKAWEKGTGRERPLRADIVAPYERWMAHRLVRCGPAANAAYRRVKRRRGAVDQVDLLVELRDLLRDRPDVRARLQGRFRQILVDEFQDTDPLQAEIVLYLCERRATARAWDEVELEPGKLTVVGDPKQSVYRFRRADISTYERVREVIRRGPHVVARITTSFRSAPPLVAWLNDRFDRLLGPPGPEGSAFDAAAGTVSNEPLVAGQAAGPGGQTSLAVTVIPVVSADDTYGPRRRAEARAIATFLRATVDEGRRTVIDPTSGDRRAIRLGDFAVLTLATTELRLLFPELDRLGIPYAVRGSNLFLSDPLHRQFLLALRRLSDAGDGLAEAALLRPPFFALDLDDLARARVEGTAEPGAVRVRAARELLAELRRTRLERSPGATALELLERTGLGRAVALRPGGEQRLASLRELCLRLDAIALEEGLDFDAVTHRVRGWAVDPVDLDPPRPVGAEAVQVLSVHQAKGLEFPAVVLWDSCAGLALGQRERPPFAVARDGRSWEVSIEGLGWSDPDGSFGQREHAFRNAERRRVVYVAATRARDLLVLPVARDGKPGWIHSALAADPPDGLVETLEPFDLAAPPAWAAGAVPPSPAAPVAAPEVDDGVHGRWMEALALAARPGLAPASVTGEARREEPALPPAAAPVAVDPDAADEDEPARPRRESRFGPVFGETVHRAIGLALADAGLAPADAVARAAVATGLAERREEAAHDVSRALVALGAAGLRRAPGTDLRLEYAMAAAARGGESLVQGYADLVGVASGEPGGLTVVDFKTDAPPAPGARVQETHAEYVAQVRAYARMMEDLGVAEPGSVRSGLLFTASGELRWVG